MTADTSPLQSYLFHLYPHEPNDLFHQARQAAVALNKAAISLSHNEARLMACLIRSHGCKKVVEIGTLTGASALWILQGMGPGGSLWTLEKDPQHAQAARHIFQQYEQAHSDRQIHLVEGDARETLKSLGADGPFDGIFIDGNKAAYLDYLNWAEAHLEKGALILADNVFLGGAVFTGNTAQFSKKQIEVMRAFNERLADPEKYFSAIVPTGEGLFVAVKLFESQSPGEIESPVVDSPGGNP
jgi:predicted O-methyltransferase YrrM